MLIRVDTNVPRARSCVVDVFKRGFGALDAEQFIGTANVQRAPLHPTFFSTGAHA